ncbi:uncharacterized protein LOC135493585 isoform X3 [Lineus longissimus]|uniref:uncharacterized protein LOC135493585 isoform X3 n=1 Tax=Lineus longissimus TaxID=88925 RepID=UPI00315CE5C1
MATTVANSNRTSDRSMNGSNSLSSARRGHRERLLPETLQYQRRGSYRKRTSRDSIHKEEQERIPKGEGKFAGLKRHPKARAMLSTVTSLAVGSRRAKNQFARSREGYKSSDLGAALKKQVSQITLIRRNMKELHMHVTSRFKNPGEAKALFKKCVRRAVIFLAWVSVLNEKSNNVARQFRTFTDMVAEIDNEDEYESENLKELKEAGLSFDKNYFKATKEVRLTPEVLSILTLSPDARTDEMCQQVLQRLQAMKIFSDYPIHIQEKLCRAAWYLPLPPKKRIIQEGHHAENFYAVLSGQALVRVRRQDPSTGETVQQTVSRIKKGENFGELAIIYRTQRTETVESASHMQLLVVGRDEFLHIFLNTEDENEEPDHVRFCRQLAFLKNWPMEKLIGEPTKCLSHFFRPGTIVATDCRNSEWIYIVKSGNVQILKQLHSVKPRSPRREQATPILPRIGSVHPASRIDTGIPRSRGVSVPKPVSRAMTEFFETRRFLIKQTCGKVQTLPKTQRIVKPSSKTSTPRAEEEELFVEAAVLREGEVIGLDNLPLYTEKDGHTNTERTIFSAVSQGAEVVLFSKRFFVQHASTEVKQFVHSEVRPFPDNDSLQDKLQVHVDWDKYKTEVVGDFLKQRRLLLDLGAVM